MDYRRFAPILVLALARMRLRDSLVRCRPSRTSRRTGYELRRGEDRPNQRPGSVERADSPPTRVSLRRAAPMARASSSGPPRTRTDPHIDPTTRAVAEAVVVPSRGVDPAPRAVHGTCRRLKSKWGTANHSRFRASVAAGSGSSGAGTRLACRQPTGRITSSAAGAMPSSALALPEPGSPAHAHACTKSGRVELSGGTGFTGPALIFRHRPSLLHADRRRTAGSLRSRADGRGGSGRLDAGLGARGRTSTTRIAPRWLAQLLHPADRANVKGHGSAERNRPQSAFPFPDRVHG